METSNDYDERARGVGRTVAAVRTQRGLTLDQLHKKLEAIDHPIHPDSLSRVETGKRKLSVQDLFAIADVLGVEAGQLLAGRIDATVTASAVRGRAAVARAAVVPPATVHDSAGSTDTVAVTLTPAQLDVIVEAVQTRMRGGTATATATPPADES